MALIPCDSQWHRITRMWAEANGYGTVRNARINAFRAAYRIIGDAYFGQMDRARCSGRCDRRVWPRNRALLRPPFTTFSRPIRRADGSFRVKCKLSWVGWVKCVPAHQAFASAGGYDGGYNEALIGPFVDMGDAASSQLAAMPPDGGGKSGIFPVSVEAEEEGATAATEYFYVMYLPGGVSEEADTPEDDGFETIALEGVNEEELEGLLDDEETEIEPPDDV